MKREKFGSRLGFILVSAGCAIGIGNVWKFPYMCGEFGGAAFILIYLLFLVILGIPVPVSYTHLDVYKRQDELEAEMESKAEYKISLTSLAELYRMIE